MSGKRTELRGATAWSKARRGTIGYSMFPNLSANGWGEPDARAQGVRELNRNLEFRQAISSAMDRQRLGNSLLKGPFTAIYPGGLYAGTSFYDKDSTVYYPFSVDTAKAHLEAVGLTDTDGNGFVNLAGGDDGRCGRQSVDERVFWQGLRQCARQWQFRLGHHPQRDRTDHGGFQHRPLAPTGPTTSAQHRANPAGELDLLPYEQQMVDTVNAASASRDPAEQVELMKTYQKLHTENLDGIGLTAYPGALIINQRFSNIPAGAPIYMYNWAGRSCRARCARMARPRRSSATPSTPIQGGFWGPNPRGRRTRCKARRKPCCRARASG